MADLTFDARFAGGRWQKSGNNPAVRTSATSQSITSRMSAENNWSLCVLSAGALMPTPRLAPLRNQSFCVALRSDDGWTAGTRRVIKII
jgi:hypothetical protein